MWDKNPIRKTHFLPLCTVSLVRAFPLLILSQPLYQQILHYRASSHRGKRIFKLCLC